MTAVDRPDNGQNEGKWIDGGCSCGTPGVVMNQHNEQCSLRLCRRCSMANPDHLPGDDLCRPCNRPHLDASGRAGVGAHDSRPDVLAAKLLATLAGDPGSWPGLHSDAEWLLRLIRTHGGRAGDGEQQRAWRPEDGDSRCQQCGRPNPIWFAPDRLWNHVVGGDPGREAQGVLCPSCFAAKADELLAVLGGTQPDGEVGERHVPHRGSDVEAWLKAKRDECGPIEYRIRDAQMMYAWRVLDHLLDDYRLRADIGSTLSTSAEEMGPWWPTRWVKR